MIFHNTFTTATVAIVFLLVSKIQNNPDAQPIITQKQISTESIGMEGNGGYFFGYYMRIGGIFGDKNLRATGPVYKSNRNVNHYQAMGEIFGLAKEDNKKVKIICGPKAQTIDSIKDDGEWYISDKEFLFYQKCSEEGSKRPGNKPLLRNLGCNIIKTYDTNKNHICYLAEFIEPSGYTLSSPLLNQLITMKHGAFNTVYKQFSQSIRLAKKLGFLYTIDKECVRIHNNFDVAMDCFNDLDLVKLLSKTEHDERIMFYNAGIYDFFRGVTLTTKLSKEDQDRMHKNYIEPLLVPGVEFLN
ncbi:hypothetical protein BDF19DRAFT_411315 [Syncephalis fuscata]|nr:hypothetical protein BDF19DRAFT_411315 [Syncephalis fuscata]